MQSVKEQELVRDMEETEMSIVIAKGIWNTIIREVFSDFMHWKEFKVFEDWEQNALLLVTWGHCWPSGK